MTDLSYFNESEFFQIKSNLNKDIFDNDTVGKLLYQILFNFNSFSNKFVYLLLC